MLLLKNFLLIILEVHKIYCFYVNLKAVKNLTAQVCRIKPIRNISSFHLGHLFCFLKEKWRASQYIIFGS